MSILSKLFTAIKGGAREVTQSIVDKNGLRIFEQEIADAESALTTAKKNLTEVMAKEMQSKRKVRSLMDSVAEHEGYAKQALAKGDESLALEIAEKIAQLDNERQENDELLNQYIESVYKLKQQVKDAEKIIKENQRQLAMVKTTESVQQATMAVNDTLNVNDNAMTSAKASLERIKQRQADRADQLTAAKALDSETNGGELQVKLERAGIAKSSTQSANDVLARLKGE